MKEVTKTVNQYEVGDLVMLVKDNKFGGPRKKTIVRVTSKQDNDGFFYGDVVTGTYVTGERFHWANVKLLTTREIAANKRRIIKSLTLTNSEVGVSYTNRNVVLTSGYEEVMMSLTEAKLLASYINSL